MSENLRASALFLPALSKHGVSTVSIRISLTRALLYCLDCHRQALCFVVVAACRGGARGSDKVLLGRCWVEVKHLLTRACALSSRAVFSSDLPNSMPISAVASCCDGANVIKMVLLLCAEDSRSYAGLALSAALCSSKQ